MCQVDRQIREMVGNNSFGGTRSDRAWFTEVTIGASDKYRAKERVYHVEPMR